MTPQQPAQGVLQINNWGTSKMYKAVCECCSDDCTHTIDIEAEDTGINVTIYTKTRTNFWSKTRWHHIWTLLTKGYVDSEAVIIMPKQVALNYASVLQSAVKDVDDIRKQNGKTKSS
jgi:N-acetyl-gamma-glutamylphosphate reductase